MVGVEWGIKERRETVRELEFTHNGCLVAGLPGDAYLVGASIWEPCGQGLVVEGGGWGRIFVPSFDMSLSSAQGARLPTGDIVPVGSPPFWATDLDR